MWCAGLQLIENRITDALGVAPQMRIPESQCFDAARLQKLFPFQVMFPLIRKPVLAAVQFHIQIRLLATEIEIVNADGMLAAKLVAGKTTATQPSPHELFRPRFFFAKLAGAFDVGHDGNLGNADETGKLVFRPPSFLPLLGGEGRGEDGRSTILICVLRPPSS